MEEFKVPAAVKWRSWELCPDLPDWTVHHVLNPKLENWSTMEWGEAWGLGGAGAEVCGASKGQPHVQSAGLGRPQEATMMILGRAEKFLSCDAGKGMGREGGRTHSPLNPTVTSLPSGLLKHVRQIPLSNLSGFHYSLVT